MEYQYHSQRFRCLPDERRVGTVNVGDIIYIQDGVRPFQTPTNPAFREPWRVEAWIPREVLAIGSATRRPVMRRCAGGHLALVRSLRASRRTSLIADWILLACVNAGRTR